MPVAAAVAALDDAPRRRAVLGGGDVYQLCFTAPAAQREAVQAAARAASAQVTRVGQTLAQSGLQVLDGQGRPLADLPGGFDHFPSA
ncbi:thiamine monophosphate kinase [compost metagenome]